MIDGRKSVQRIRLNEKRQLRGNNGEKPKPGNKLAMSKKLVKNVRGESNSVESNSVESSNGGSRPKIRIVPGNGGKFSECLKTPVWKKLNALIVVSCECTILIALTG